MEAFLELVKAAAFVLLIYQRQHPCKHEQASEEAMDWRRTNIVAPCATAHEHLAKLGNDPMLPSDTGINFESAGRCVLLLKIVGSFCQLGIVLCVSMVAHDGEAIAAKWKLQHMTAADEHTWTAASDSS
jgi:hypothetical protein